MTALTVRIRTLLGVFASTSVGACCCRPDSVADVPDRERSVSDRRLLVAIAESASIGVVCVGVAVWATLHPPSQDQPYWLMIAPIGGVVAGVIFIGFALAELIRRLRRGPEEPGRHTRP